MMETYFAPSQRTEGEKLNCQIIMVSQSPLVNTFLTVMAGILVILNEDRQIIALNDTFLQSLGITDPEQPLGLRLGESVGCPNAKIMAGGCGTSKHCASCGAVIAMMSTLETNESAERICALEVEVDGIKKSLALLVRTSPLVLMDQRLLVVAVRDIIREQLRANLERVFYHDINNILTSLLAPSEMLLREMPHRWEVVQINEAARRLRQEVALQRELSLAGNGDYIPEKKQVPLSEINKDIELLMRGHVAAKGRTIQVQQECEDFLIYTDKMLVSRVLANMLINALEATLIGGAVKFVARRTGKAVVWEVWNYSHIAEEIQPRIFQRHFSTKPDAGRGLGTFSMKLFGETYLRGTIGFTSTRESGTLFSFTLPV
ncbi:MAG: HAMP domain-containing sensor histidine kinase [Pseudomonadota bacterium]